MGISIRAARQSDVGTLHSLIRALAEYEKLASQVVGTAQDLQRVEPELRLKPEPRPLLLANRRRLAIEQEHREQDERGSHWPSTPPSTPGGKSTLTYPCKRGSELENFLCGRGESNSHNRKITRT